MLSASRFGFSLKGRKQGTRGTLPIMAYLGLPTSDLPLAATDGICQRGTRRWRHNTCATAALGGTG